MAPLFPSGDLTLKRMLAALLLAALAWGPAAHARNLGKDLERLHRQGSAGGGRWALVVRPLPGARGAKGAFSADADLRLLPASTAKLFTCYAVASLLPPDTAFETTVSTPGSIDQGVLAGDLWLRGWGAPGIRSRPRSGVPGDTAALVLGRLAQRILGAGIQWVEGDVRVDNSFYEDSDSLGAGWQWDDLPWWYAAPVTPLAVDDNAADVLLHPASGAMQLLTPQLPRNWEIVPAVKAAAAGKPTDLRFRWTGPRSGWISGWLGQEDTLHRETIAIARPELFAADCFRLALEASSVRLRLSHRPPSGQGPGREIASVAWPPLRDVYPPVLGRSQNLEAEMLLRDLGGARGEASSVAGGLAVVQAELAKLGLSRDDVRLVDGCGLSRLDYTTAEALCRVLERVVARADSGDAGMMHLLDGLARPGETGSLNARFRDSPWSDYGPGWLRAKTGSMDGVSAFAGVLRSPTGERYVFASIRNNFPESRRQAVAWEERLVRTILGLPDTESK